MKRLWEATALDGMLNSYYDSSVQRLPEYEYSWSVDYVEVPAGASIYLSEWSWTVRVAVFVDAGYLYAGGSAAIAGSAQTRDRVELNRFNVVDKLKAVAVTKADGASLLRIYWYDGVLPGGVSSEQQSIADTDDVKLRLGTISPFGRQKGVDSLIVTDLVELARNQAISDAVLLSGDEDVRIGVQIAQSFGGRVHLIGMEPSQNNQSRTLMQESDTRTEWSKAEIGEFLTLKLGSNTSVAPDTHEDSSETGCDTKSLLDEVIATFAESLGPDRLSLIADLDEAGSIPNEIDSPLLGKSRSAIGRELTFDERRYLRDQFKQTARRTTSANL